MKQKSGMRIGILTAGGDCPGLNSAIRAIGKTAILEYGMEVVGISSGFSGLINKDITILEESMLSGILTLGGTILRTSREKPFESEDARPADKPGIIKKNINELGLDCIICMGGNGTMKTAWQLSRQGINVIGLPKTIDNDVWGTDVTFGFHSAVDIATDAIDRVHTTANSHKRVMVIEVMGHNAGWLGLYSGLAGGGDIILIPEIRYDLNAVAKAVIRRYDEKKPYSIIVVAEGIKTEKKRRKGHYIAKSVMELTGIETRETILGYIQRGGAPSAYDRIISTWLGSAAVDLASRKKFGVMAALINGKTTAVPLKRVAGRLKTVPVDDPLIARGRSIGVSFGDV